MLNWFKSLLGPKENPKEWLARGAIVVDVRTPNEFRNGHAKGAINVPLDKIDSVGRKVKKDQEVVLCCASGMRSRTAMKTMKHQGFTRLLNAGPWTALRLILAVTMLSLTSCAQTTGSQNLDVDSFAASISPEVLLVDVRTPGEWKEGVIEGAIMVDFYGDGFMEVMMALDSEKPWIIYCRSGNRSGQALEKLNAAGQVNVKDLQGGVKAWVASGRSLVSPY